MRALSLWLPEWKTDLARRRLARLPPSGSPGDMVPALPRAIVLSERFAQRHVVAACCAAAARAGVHPGMTLAHARALLPATGTHVEDHDPRRDHESLVRLAMWAHRFTPVAAVDPPDGLLLDITGCERAFKGEGRLIRRVLEGAEWLGFRGRAAIAPTFGAAWALARYADRRAVIVPGERVRDAIALLPVEGLRVAPEIAEALAELGVETIGQVMGLPRAALPARFGGELLHRLGQALGEVMEVIEPVRPVSMPRAELVYDGPTTRLDAIEMGVRSLLDDLARQLASREAGARVVLVQLDRADLAPLVLTLRLSRPCRDARHLWTLLRPKLERAQLGYGIERVEITAPRTGRLRHRQTERWREEEDGTGVGSEADLASLIDVLTGRLGAERVTRAEICASHIPERTVRYVPALDAPEGCRPHASFRDGGESGPLDHTPRLDRPTLLLACPEPAEAMAMVPDCPPSRLRWRGREHAIVHGFGPERISPEWWRAQTHDRDHAAKSTRDYYRVEDAGGLWLWVYREVETARWFVHGLWA